MTREHLGFSTALMTFAYVCMCLMLPFVWLFHVHKAREGLASQDGTRGNEGTYLWTYQQRKANGQLVKSKCSAGNGRGDCERTLWVRFRAGKLDGRVSLMEDIPRKESTGRLSRPGLVLMGTELLK